jgi:PadR family transcriptional regulator, regulatory protein PadR
MRAEALGEFEQLVLLAILRVSPDAYGVTIRQEIEARTGRAVTIGALYTALDRLDRKGFVSSSMSDPTPQRGGRAKRYYKLRPGGAAALKRSRRALDSMWAGITPDLSKGRSS